MWTIPCSRKYSHLQNKTGIHQLSNPPPPHTHTHTQTHTHTNTHTHTHTHTHTYINTTHNPKIVPDNSVTSPDSHSTCTSKTLAKYHFHGYMLHNSTRSHLGSLAMLMMTADTKWGRAGCWKGSTAVPLMLGNEEELLSPQSGHEKPEIWSSNKGESWLFWTHSSVWTSIIPLNN